MRKVLYAGFALGAVVALIGCGGGSGGSSSSEPANPLTGMYGGPGKASTSSDAIVARIGIGQNSLLCGMLVDRTAKTRTLLGALVSDNGVLTNGSVQTVDANDTPLSTGTLSGTITVLSPGATGSSTLGAVLNVATSSGSITYTFDSLSVAHYRTGKTPAKS